MHRDRPPGTVAVRLLAFPGVDDLDLLGAYGVLSKAAELSRQGPPPWLDVAIATDRTELETAGGLRLSGQVGLDEIAGAGSPDAVLVPGGRGIRQVLGTAAYLDYLRAAHRDGAALYSVCSGALLVAAAGLATGATLAIHSAKRNELGERCRPGTGLVRDGRLTSVGGDRSGSVKSVDLALQLVADHAPGVLPELLDRTELRQGRTLAAVPATPAVPSEAPRAAAGADRS
jgi:transcriptional regulator GlxA family with amidase domain